MQPQIDVSLMCGGGRAARLAAAGNNPVRPRKAGTPASKPIWLKRFVAAGRNRGVWPGRDGRDDAGRSSFVDRWRLRRGGRLVFAETLRLEGEIGEARAPGDRAKGGVAIGTALIVPGDEAPVTRMRAASNCLRGEVGISAWNGFAMARFCAEDAAELRADMISVLGIVGGQALPRLWPN